MNEYNLGDLWERCLYDGVVSHDHSLMVIVNPFETVMHEQDVLEHDGMPYIDIREPDTGKTIWSGILGTLDIDSISSLSIRESLEPALDDAEAICLRRLYEPIDVPGMPAPDSSVTPMSYHDLLMPGGAVRLHRRLYRLDLGRPFFEVEFDALCEAQRRLRHNFDTCVYEAMEVRNWFEFYHPGNLLAGDIRAGLEFGDMIAALLRGKSFEVAAFEHAPVGSTNLDIRQFLEAAKKYGQIDYDLDAVDKIDALAAVNARHVLNKEDFYRGVYCADDSSIIKVDPEKTLDSYYSNDNEPGMPVIGLYDAPINEEIGLPVPKEQVAWGHTAREVDECLQDQNAFYHLTDREAYFIDAAHNAFMARMREPVIYSEMNTVVDDKKYLGLQDPAGITYLDLLTPEGMGAIPEEVLPDVMDELEDRLFENEYKCAALLEQERGDKDLEEER